VKRNTIAQRLEGFYPMGGENRLVHMRSEEEMEASPWKCPEPLKNVFLQNDPTKIRMVLATPAIFADGWRPGWLDESTLQGRPFAEFRMLKLVGVAIPRWQPVSGWALAAHPGESPGRRVIPQDKPGPKALRRMAPRGSVYFFEKVDGTCAEIAHNGWLRSVSDHPPDRRDGFGLAVWGVW
jgi:CRISPR-associated protein Cmr3